MDHSDVAQWQYVPSKSNPADYGSRGLDRTCLAKIKTWYEGPKFLWEPESSWKRDHTVKDIDTDHPETKKEVFVNSTEVKTDILETLETHFSNWDKIRKAIPKRDKTELHPQIGTSEQLLSIAEIEIGGKKTTMAQSRAFAEEKLSRFSKQ